jgi:hypothetical protein
VPEVVVKQALTTRHARHRVHQRLGLPKRAVARLADRALVEGLAPEQASGDLRRYLVGKLASHRETQGSTARNAAVRAFKGACFIFSGETLVTCWALPRFLKAAA